MKCKKVDKLLIDYLYGELKIKKALKIEEHINSCTACSAKFSELEAAKNAAKEIPQFEPNSRIDENIIRYATRESMCAPVRSRLAYKPLGFAFNAAVAAVFVLAAIFFLKSGILSTLLTPQKSPIAHSSTPAVKFAPQVAQQYAPVKIEIPIKPQPRIDEAFVLYKEGKDLKHLQRFNEAINSFNLFRTKFPNHPKTADVISEIAECYYSMGNYTKASQLFMQAKMFRQDTPLETIPVSTK